MKHYQHLIESFALITGSKGAFEFRVDGELLYSKWESSRHAQPGEILDIFRAFVGPNIPTYPQS
jgi:selenoprotein W-related protein